MRSPRVVLCAAARTPIGSYGCSLKDMPATELGCTAINGTLRRARIEGSVIDSVVIGQALQAGAKSNPARLAAILAEIPASVPAMTINRACGSGAQAVIAAAQEVLLGHACCVLAGGMENMDQAPFLLSAGRWGHGIGDGRLLDSMLRDGLNDPFTDQHAGWLAEDLAGRFDITRHSQDRWAHRSRERFTLARAAGWFADELVAVEQPTQEGVVLLAEDEGPQAFGYPESLASQKPLFRLGGTITDGNSAAHGAGAAVLIVADETFAERQGIEPMARLAGWGVGAVEPRVAGLGALPAFQQALNRAGWTRNALERVELDEPYAVTALALIRQLDLPEEVVNIDGGAIAHGRPIGAMGAVLTTKLLHAMKRVRVRRAMVAMSIGGGQGVALALEAP